MSLRSRARSWWRSLRERLHYLRVFMWPDVVLLEGRTASGAPLSILRAGISDTGGRYFFASEVLAELRCERTLGRHWIWTLPALARTHGCAFSVLRVATPRAALARRMLACKENSVFHLPGSVGATVDVEDEPRLLQCHSLRDDVRRLKRRGFGCHISRQQQELEEFIRRYHDVYVHGRHGFAALEMDFHKLLASCADGELPDPWVLLKVQLADEWVAGVLLLDGQEGSALMELGVRDGDPVLVKQGALWATYWLALQYLRAQGRRWVNLMHTPPFLSNGVLQYKLKFSPKLTAARPNDGFLLCFDKHNAAAREVMLREPLLVFKGEGLGLVWFAGDPSAAPDPVRIPLRRLAVAGVEDVERIVL